MIKRHAVESPDGDYLFTVNNPNELLYKFRLGIDDKNHLAENCGVFHDFKNYTGLPRVEVWISTRKPIEDIPECSDFIDIIHEFDDTSESERIDYANKIEPKLGFKCYDYHLVYVPAAYVADFFPSLYPKSIGDEEIPVQGHPAVNTETGEVVTFEKGSLAEFAVSHGCDFMDMSSMTLYRGL